jgi:hypothetical protein
MALDLYGEYGMPLKARKFKDTLRTITAIRKTK